MLSSVIQIVFKLQYGVSLKMKQLEDGSMQVVSHAGLSSSVHCEG